MRTVDKWSSHETVLDPPAFTAAALGAIHGGQSRGIVVVALALDGIEAADALVLAAENRVTRAVRPGDVVGRLGGGRLAVLPGRDEGPNGAARIAERVADRLHEPFHIAGREVQPGLRIGIAGADAGDVQELIQRAEESLATVRQNSG